MRFRELLKSIPQILRHPKRRRQFRATENASCAALRAVEGLEVLLDDPRRAAGPRRFEAAARTRVGLLVRRHEIPLERAGGGVVREHAAGGGRARLGDDAGVALARGEQRERGRIPAVHEVAVFGLPHDKLGEELACAIVLESGQATTEEEIQAFAKERLAGFKVPSKVFIRSDALPRNASNKVLKAALKKQYGH